MSPSSIFKTQTVTSEDKAAISQMIWWISISTINSNLILRSFTSQARLIIRLAMTLFTLNNKQSPMWFADIMQLVIVAGETNAFIRMQQMQFQLYKKTQRR